MNRPRPSSHYRFTLLEVVVALLIFAAAISALLSVLGTARARLLRAERGWARAHLLASAVEFHLLAGDTERLPPDVLPEGFYAECWIDDIRLLPEEAEEEISGWRLAEFTVVVFDPMGEQIAGQTVRKMIPRDY